MDEKTIKQTLKNFRYFQSAVVLRQTYDVFCPAQTPRLNWEKWGKKWVWGKSH